MQQQAEDRVVVPIECWQSGLVDGRESGLASLRRALDMVRHMRTVRPYAWRSIAAEYLVRAGKIRWALATGDYGQQLLDRIRWEHSEGDRQTVVATVLALADKVHGPMRIRTDLPGSTVQRYVPILTARRACGIPPWRFDRAVASLAEEYAVWLRTDWGDHHIAHDNASVQHRGNSCHEITADPWRVDTD